MSDQDRPHRPVPKPGPPRLRPSGVPRRSVPASRSGPVRTERLDARPRPGDWQAAGPLGRSIGRDRDALRTLPGLDLGTGANGLIMMRRVVFVDQQGDIDKDGAKLLLEWAAQHRLGQDGALLRQAADRRTAALAALRARGQGVVRLRVRPEWRMAVGLGNRANPHEIGLSLHGTYGWPVIPGSSLKGLTAAWAQQSQQSRPAGETMEQIFGSPRPRGATASQAVRRGSVCFLDAFPAGEPVAVTVDVVTPHAQRYYTSAKDDRTPEVIPPAEHHNPIPSMFLTVSGGEFAVDLTGPPGDVRDAARWCAEAFDELGAGGKTAAGYGYAAVTVVEDA
jgi:CRISPR type III-B/RAMP module RAMP protein Cmr6